MGASAATEMLREILEIVHHLVAERGWPKVLREDAFGQPAQWADYNGGTQWGLMSDWVRVADLLMATECKRYLGINKKQRRYLCPSCHAIDLRPEPPFLLAHLEPNEPTSTRLYCFVCDDWTNVKRVKCAHCPGNVQDEEDRCLTCDRDNSECV